MTRLFDLEVKGFKAVIKTFNVLDDNLQRKVLRQALRSGAKIIQKAAKAKSPVGITGNNKKFIKIKSLKRSRVTVGVAVVTGTREQLGIPRDEFGYYPMVLEYGSKHVKKQPFMKPALEQNREKVIKEIAKKIEAGIEKILRGKK